MRRQRIQKTKSVKGSYRSLSSLCMRGPKTSPVRDEGWEHGRNERCQSASSPDVTYDGRDAPLSHSEGVRKPLGADHTVANPGASRIMENPVMVFRDNRVRDKNVCV